MAERLQKYLARLGVGSRREVELWIREGHVLVNGEAAILGCQVDHDSKIAVNGKIIDQTPHTASYPRVLMYHKPQSEICTRVDPAGRPTVFQNLPILVGSRWVSVGRLDLNSEGLLLFTNDGDLANKMMHPKYGLERQYLCRIYGKVSKQNIEQLKSGIILDNKKCSFKIVRFHSGVSKNQWYDVVLGEGRYREVRRLWAAVGCTVSRLIRIRYGSIKLPKNLKVGKFQELSTIEVAKLLEFSTQSEQLND